MRIENLSRRGFLGAGSGLLLGFHLTGCKKIPPNDTTVVLGAVAEGQGEALNAWIQINPDGVVTLRMGASEMGQGVFTSLPMILAEELDCDWQQVRVESAAASKPYDRLNVDYPGSGQLTGGSLSVRGYWDELHDAGAAARAMLVSAAAKRWKVDEASCTTDAGRVICGDQSAGFGELVADAATMKPPKKPTRKAKEDWRLLGTSPARLDLPSKVDGSALFGIDVSVEGMQHATVLQCPHFGGTLVSFDAEQAMALDGIVAVFQIEGWEAIAVVADSTWLAKKGRDLLEVEWDAGDGAGLDDAEIGRRLDEAIAGGGKVVDSHGTVGETTVEATYEVPYLDHAPLEPLSATVRIQGDTVDVWTSTQNQDYTKNRTAQICGVPKKNVNVHTTMLGGGFGRRGFWDWTDQAAAIAKHLQVPVKLTWTREEQFARGYYRPRIKVRFRGAIGTDGLPTDYQAVLASQSILEGLAPNFLLGLELATETAHGGVSHTPYAIPNVEVQYARISLPIHIGWWRSVHGSHNGFFRESFLDELAHAGGQDPIAMRRTLMKDNPRFLACFDLAVDKAPALPEGQSRGVAIFQSFGSIVASVADVSVTEGQLRVHHVTSAVDCGHVVHPDTVEAQIMGAAVMGVSSMYEEVAIADDGQAQVSNFHQYPLLNLAAAPTVDVHIVESDEPPGGIGEVGLPPVLGAVGNAIFAATGKRIRKLPLGDQLA